MRLIDAFKAFFSVLGGAPVEAKSVPAEEEPAKPAVLEPKQDEFLNGAVYSLTLLQREGRLIDFLMEDLSGYQDAQIGAAVRQIHDNCRGVLNDTFKLQRVLEGEEGKQTEVAPGFDPSAIRLTGNVPEEGPFKGTLQHQGWKAGEVKLPSRNAGIDPTVVYPAEISF